MKHPDTVIIFGLFAILESAKAIDPFEAFFRLDCLTDRGIKGCRNETLADAYLKTKDAQSDEIFSKPETAAYLFTRSNPQKPEFLHKCAGRLPANTVYRKDGYTQILLSGFLSSTCGFAYFREMKDQLLHRDDYNVIIVDGSWGNQLDYYSAVRNGKVVGKQIAFLMRNIMDQTNATGENFHLIGHSLGAHAMGIAARYLRRGQIRRITGLDPAGPAYQKSPPEDRLDKTDAKMVDIIHTNGGDCVPFSFGYFEPSGHADFYVNGGKFQQGCFASIIPRYLKGDIIFATGSLFPPICSHLHSAEYFKASINACHCQFIGVECNNYKEFTRGKCRSCGSDGSRCAVMGMDWEFYPVKEGNHSYYLDTDTNCPYCNNKKINREGFPGSPIKGNKTPHCFTPKSE